ncbi:MAG TPA: cbb3-type cytochrome oxidase assembly protein CcoS [Gammaproteobacteria bacterium]|nr:cbb3-type cytochrome oxidase assembly protein CcoS [Gammaproteobacteria bacterium]
MEIIWWLIAVSVVLVGLITWAFLWAVDSGQFDDLDGPATAILMDDDPPAGGAQRDTPPASGRSGSA